MSSHDAAGQGDPWVAVAKVLRPHGLGGTMRLQPLTRFPEELIEGPIKQFHIRQGGEIVGPFTLVEGRFHQGIIMAQFAGIHDRTAAEKYTNADLVVREEELWELPEDMYYIHQLAGLEVRESGTDKVLGKVRTAQEGAAHDYLILDLVQKRGVMLPLTPMFVPVVNIASGFVEVAIPPGLLD